jgi:hypothetical protein
VFCILPQKRMQNPLMRPPIIAEGVDISYRPAPVTYRSRKRPLCPMVVAPAIGLPLRLTRSSDGRRKGFSSERLFPLVQSSHATRPGPFTCLPGPRVKRFHSPPHNSVPRLPRTLRSVALPLRGRASLAVRASSVDFEGIHL